MKTIAVICVIGSFAICNARTDEWLQKRMAAIDSAESLPLEEKFEILGGAVRAGYWTMIDKPNENQLAVSSRASKLLLAIPGHAEYYRDRILKVQEAYKAAGSGTVSERGPIQTNYQNERMYGFQTLALLPSPETVRVLGEFLFNEWTDPLLEDNPIHERTPPLSMDAVAALKKLPLANKPTGLSTSSESLIRDTRAWQLWYEQIKAGTRTFRFEGDPQEYRLAGPVREARDGPLTERSAKRGENGADSDEPERNVRSPGRAILIALAALLLGGSVWRYFALRKREAR